MVSGRSIPIALAVLALATPVAALTAQTAATRTGQVQQQVESLAEPADIESRRAVIVKELEQLGLTPSLFWFDPPAARANRRGANVIAELPGAGVRTLLLGAHYDHIDLAQGVIDNAAGVVAVLQLAEALTRNPLHNFKVHVALFDLEENGLLGSRAMVSDSLRTPLPEKYLNFDVFGYGDALWLSAMEAATPIPMHMRSAAGGAGMTIVVDSLYPPSDHLSYRGTSTASYAVSLVEADDINAMLGAIRERRMPVSPPRVMQIIHTPQDTLDKLDADAVARALEIVERAIREMDAAAGS
jgi:aminopeptidase S